MNTTPGTKSQLSTTFECEMSAVRDDLRPNSEIVKDINYCDQTASMHGNTDQIALICNASCSEAASCRDPLRRLDIASQGVDLHDQGVGRLARIASLFGEWRVRYEPQCLCCDLARMSAPVIKERGSDPKPQLPSPRAAGCSVGSIAGG